MEQEATCPRCHAPRGDGAECPRCGVIYARAAERRARDLAAAGPLELTTSAPEQQFQPTPILQTTADAALEPEELWIRRLAIPVALAAFWVIDQSDMLHALARTFLSMWVHELGHAVTAWLSGVSAVP